MEEGDVVKAPVTRLRRRLSVEQSDDGKLSPALGTPTKKRGGRRVAKPELDLIDENAVENNLKKTTKKTVVKEVIDSNEEKPVTPSRRSVRIKSNTSIVSDTAQTVNSPRAKRAARRTSQVGSDTDMPLTPARQTRRTRKDSTSSLDKQVDDAVPAVIKNTTQIPEVISEEPENVTKTTSSESNCLDNDTKLSPIRKSPRLLKKKSRSSNSSIQDEEENKVNNDKSDALDNSIITHNKSETEAIINPDIKIDNKKEKNNYDKNRLSQSSYNLIKDLDLEPKKTFSHINKSLSEAQELNKMKPKRNRTKSWTTINNTSITSEDFYSDNEIAKKKRQKKNDSNGSGDNVVDNSKCDGLNNEVDNTSKNNVKTLTGKKKIESEIPSKITPNKLESNADTLVNIENNCEITNLFKKSPTDDIQTLVLIEDSDSNSIQMNINKDNDNEDQCVPIVDHKLKSKGDKLPDYTLSNSIKNNNSIEFKNIITNDSCEPMDVDETLPNSLLADIQNKELEMQPKLLSDNLQDAFKLCNKDEKSPVKRKSSLSMSTSQNLEKSDCENKSTLILSQLKDISNSDCNVLKSPQILNKKSLSKSVDVLNVTQENATVNKKLTLNYLTSTPVQEKADLGHHSDNKSKNSFINNSSKKKPTTSPRKEISSIANRSEHSADDSESEEESSKENSNLLDSEASDAGKNYESGDSQDEEEKQYEKDHEILEKGETLTSSDELSNDSDYEKDSFLVSSDYADNELLTGSGDDLSMSDNELKMTVKSKKKYDDRKLKEQKRASREMFEARHKVNSSDISINSSTSRSKIKKNTRQRLESSQSEEDVIAPKKNKRIRLNSTVNESAIKSDADDIITSKKKKVRCLSETYDENLLAEKEITICEETTNNLSDPLATQVKSEPRTPVKESNISVGFVDTGGIKDTPSDKNITSSKSLKPKDPLNDTNSDNEESSLSSEDENITQNYNDMLNELKAKATNRSLNMEKENKIKSRSKNPIIDILNLTHTKESKKIKNKSFQNENILNTLQPCANESTTDNFSVSFQTKQLNTSKQQASEHESIKLNDSDVEKQRLGNLSLNLDKVSKKAGKQSIVDHLNLTQIKDKSRKGEKRNNKSEKQNTIENCDNSSSDSIDLKLLFSEDSINSGDFSKENDMKKNEYDIEEFIPLKKTEAKTDIRSREDSVAVENKSMLNESKKKIKEQKSVSAENEDIDNAEKEEEMPFFVDTMGTHSDSSSLAEIKKNINKICSKEDTSSTDESDHDAPPLEISYKQEKSAITKKKNNETTILNVDDTDSAAVGLAEKSFNKTIESEKKKKKKSLSQLDKTIDKSLSLTPDKGNKMKNKVSESHNVSNIKYIFPLDDENQDKNNKSINKTPGSDKKKTKRSQSNMSECKQIPASVQESDEANNKSITKTPKSDKNRSSEIFNKSELDNTKANNSLALLKNVNSEKKKKRRFSESEVDLKSETETKNNESITKETIEEVLMNEDDTQNENNTSVTNLKKRKRKSINKSFEIALEDETSLDNQKLTNQSINSQKKKRKISETHEDTDKINLNTEASESVENIQNSSLINKHNANEVDINETKNSLQLINVSQVSTNTKKKRKNSLSENQNEVNDKPKVNKNKKRKNRDDDMDTNKALKVLKENSLDQIHVPRLPPSLLNQLEEKPRKKIVMSTNRCAISTTEFIVEETKKRKNKPSNYLEESIYLNDNETLEAQKQKNIIKKPKVLPFIPTATTSNSGYTTNFKVNVIPQEIKFVAQSNNMPSFKNEYLYSKKIKRLGTYELYKRNRNIKMSKF